MRRLVARCRAQLFSQSSGNALQGTSNVDQIKVLQFSGLTFIGPVDITDTVSDNIGENGFAFVNCCFDGNVTVTAESGYASLQFISSSITYAFTLTLTHFLVNWINSDMNYGTANLTSVLMEIVSWAFNPQNLNINAGSSVTAQDGVNIGAQTVTVASGGSLTLINAIVIANLVIDSGGTVTNYLGAIEGTITNNGTYTIAGTATNFSADIMNAGTGFRINSAAASGHYLRGNGTNFVSSAIQAGDIPSGTVLWNQIGNPTGNLTLFNGNNYTVFNHTSSVIWEWANTTAATSITTNMSPIFIWQANYWDGADSSVDRWTIQSGLAAGTNGVTTLQIAHSGSAGSAYLSLQNSVEGIQFISSSASLDFGPNSSWALNLTNGSGNTNNGSLNVVSGTSLSLQAGNANPQLELIGYVTTSAVASVLLENVGNFTGTSGTQKVVNTTGTFSPTSGTATFVGHQVHVIVDQTSTASGSYEALLITATETALLGSSNFLIRAQAGSAGTTDKFSVDNSGNVVQTIGTTSAIANSPSLTLTGSYESSASGPTYAADSWSIQNVLQAATLNGTSTLTFTHSGSSGVASVSVPSLTCGVFNVASGNMTFANGGTVYFELHNGSTFSGGSATLIGFSSNTNPTVATPDTAISRVSAGILGIGTGAQGSIAGSIQC